MTRIFNIKLTVQDFLQYSTTFGHSVEQPTKQLKLFDRCNSRLSTVYDVYLYCITAPTVQYILTKECAVVNDRTG
jgi:hypothetical protein